MSTCRSCNAPIIWAVTTNKGGRMPLDADPNPDGNVELHPEQPGAPRSCTVHGQPPMLVDGEIHMPHHATCPDAESWRWT